MGDKDATQKMIIKLHIDADAALETLGKVKAEIEQIIAMQEQIKKVGAGC